MVQFILSVLELRRKGLITSGSSIFIFSPCDLENRLQGIDYSFQLKLNHRIYSPHFNLPSYWSFHTHLELVSDYAKTSYDDDTSLASPISVIHHHKGDYSNKEDLESFKSMIMSVENAIHGSSSRPAFVSNRLFHIYIQSGLVPPLSRVIRDSLFSPNGFNKVLYRITEPTRNHTSLEALLDVPRSLKRIFREEEIFRYQDPSVNLLSQHLLTLRFTNRIFEPLWNASHIDSVYITYKKASGSVRCSCSSCGMGVTRKVHSRGTEVEEERESVKDIFQNVLLRLLSCITMEPPISMLSEDIRDENVKVLRYCQPIGLDHCLFGRCSEGDSTANSSNDLTYIKCLLKIENERWSGVPFVLEAGDLLDEDLVQLRVLFKKVPIGVRGKRNAGGMGVSQNELVTRIQRDKTITTSLRLNMEKDNGAASLSNPEDSRIELSQNTTLLHKDKGYEGVLLDMLSHDQSSFVRSDELESRLRVLNAFFIDQAKDVHVASYEKHSAGPAIATLPFLRV
jgi:glucose-6-phosphate 1-dehydrogenase